MPIWYNSTSKIFNKVSFYHVSKRQVVIKLIEQKDRDKKVH